MEKNNNKNVDHLKTILICTALTVLYGLVAYLPEGLNLVDNLLSDEAPGLLYISIVFIMRFLLSAIIWIVIIPLIFYLFNKQSLTSYLKKFRFKTKNHLSRNISTGILTSVVFLLVSSVIALLLGIFYFDFSIMELRAGIADLDGLSSYLHLFREFGRNWHFEV